MSVSILVATPHAAFGELLRLSLEESGQYQVRLVQNAKEARASAGRSNYQLAILDSDLSDEPFVALCLELISQMPQLRLIVIPPDNNPNHPALGGLMPHGYLNRPFYLPDLLDTVQNLCTAKLEAEPQVKPATPDWASDLPILKSALDQELARTEAIAVLVGAQGELLSSAGQLNEASAREMATVLLRYWDPKEKTDLMRYVRLSSTKGEYLVYATEITNDMVLVMVFEPSAQLSQVRPQTKQVALNLVSHPSENPPTVLPSSPLDLHLVGSNNGHSNQDQPQDVGPVFQHASSLIEPETERLEDEGLFSVDGESFIRAESPAPQPDESAAERQNDELDLPDDEEDDPDARKIDLALLLGTIPSPNADDSSEPSNPVQPGILSDWVPQPGAWKSGLVNSPKPTEPNSPPQAPENVDTPGTQIYPEEVEFTTQPVLRKPVESTAPISIRPIFMETDPDIDPLSDTRPHVVSTLTNINQMEPVSPALSLLNYTCVLLPRLPQHYLTGDLAERLAQWVQHLCLAFGWRLEGISLRPEYLQWTVQVAPSVSPGNLVRIIRQRTSLHIFSTFDHIKQQNPSGDFWATGYLIVSGPQPPSAQLLREYIAQTRKRQGIQKI